MDLATAFGAATRYTTFLAHIFDQSAVQRLVMSFDDPGAAAGVVPKVSVQLLVDDDPASSSRLVPVAQYGKMLEVGNFTAGLRPGCLKMVVDLVAGTASQFSTATISIWLRSGEMA